MPRRPKSSTSEAPRAPMPSEILDQFVRQGPLTPEALDAVVRRFKKAIIEGPWGVRFPTVVAAWRPAWTHVIPFLAFPPDVRRVIATTNALESVHARLRTIIKTRGHVPNDEAATTLLWLALRHITATGVRGVRRWKEAMHQFAILDEDRGTPPTA